MTFEGKTILVTGAAGFIGSHIVEELLKRDDRPKKIIGMDNLVAGKTAKTIARRLTEIFGDIKTENTSPFEALRNYNGDLSELLKKHGVGCYSQKARTINQLVNSKLNLRTCGYEDLEKIWGIGMKTSRCFLMHTRKGVRVAGLDTHILKFLRENGINAPTNTPSKRQYLELEQEWLKLVPERKTPAEYDFEIWKKYSKNK